MTKQIKEIKALSGKDANKFARKMLKKEKQTQKKECKRHDWRVGSYIGYLIGKRIMKKGIHIKCYKCGKVICAYYKGK